ncbi:E3 ubiquitin-protein ligase TRIM45-like [Saccostrea cucullata]|uniref:E3 ubiquitin-protein ligase TRIM45-like n=1 Tax=Saccostrea cuccullata TaxID=36930 RepID=UPI002ED327EE
MATANVKGFVNNIESMCECNICYVAYDEIKHIPRLLPCHHTFCSECLSKHCKGQKLKCPYCMKEHNVRNRDINIFPKDNTRRDLKELLEKFSQSLCGVCRRHDNVKYFCGTCRIRMCRGCYKERKQNVCIMHDIDIPEDSSMTPDTSLESPEIHSKDVCLLPGHENNQLKYFCSEIACSKPACSNCVVELHNGHDYKPIKNEYENRMQSMKNSCMATHAKIVKANELLKIVENQHFSMTENFRKGRDKLSLEANKGIRYINDFEENASKNTNEIIQENLTVLDRKKEQLKFFIENATECCAISEEALTGNNFITFLSVEKTLREKLILFEKSEVDKPLDPMTEGDFELENPIMELRKRIERMTRNGDENTGGDNSFQGRLS